MRESRFRSYKDDRFGRGFGKEKFNRDRRDGERGQIGNPEGEDKPNKKYYDPRAFLREGEKSVVERLKIAFSDLNCIDRL